MDLPVGNDLINEKILFTGLGSFGGVILSNFLYQTVGEMFPNFGVEVVSLKMILLGSFLMTQDSKVDRIGLGIGTAGTVVLLRAVYLRFLGEDFGLDKEDVQLAMPQL